MNYFFNDELVKQVERFNEIANKGYYANSQQVTDAYNKIFSKREPNTNCSSCIRRRIREMYSALEKFRQDMEKNAPQATQTPEVDNVSTEPEKVAEKPKKQPKTKNKK